MAETDIRYLTGDDVRCLPSPGGAGLRIQIGEEQCIVHGRVRRLLPLSEPDTFFSIQDAAGKEIGVLRSLAGLDEESRLRIEDDLDRRYFTPKISAIRSLKQEGGLWTFEVDTSRGESTFYVRNWRDSSHEISPGRFSISSVDGQRFEVPDFDALDTRSQVLLEQLF